MHDIQKTDTVMSEEVITKARVELPPGLLAKVQALYDLGLCRQAYDLGNASVPLENWQGADADLLAGRILLNMGATRRSFRHHIRAFRAEPDQLRTQAYYLEVFLQMRGPVFAWQKFRGFEKAAQAVSGPHSADEGWEYLFSLQGL